MSIILKSTYDSTNRCDITLFFQFLQYQGLHVPISSPNVCLLLDSSEEYEVTEGKSKYKASLRHQLVMSLYFANFNCFLRILWSNEWYRGCYSRICVWLTTSSKTERACANRNARLLDFVRYGTCRVSVKAYIKRCVDFIIMFI